MNPPPADVDFADPDAVLGDPGAGGDQRPAAPSGRPPHDGRNGTDQPEDDDWGLRKENRGMSTETKIGLSLVVLLLVTFGFVVWKKMEQQGNAVASRYEQETERIEREAEPPKRNKAPKKEAPKDDGPPAQPKRREYAENTGAKPIPVIIPESRDPRTDGSRTRTIEDEFAFDDFEPPRQPGRTEQPRNTRDDSGFADYEFSDDLFLDDERPRRDDRGRRDEPARIEVVEFDWDSPRDAAPSRGDSRIRPTAGEEECPIDEFAFDDDTPKQQPRTGRDRIDDWDDFAPIERRTARPITDQRGRGDGWDDPGGQFEPIDVNPRRRTDPFDEECPIPGAEPRPMDPRGRPGTGTVQIGPIESGPAGYPAGTRIHTVANGETYWNISRAQYGTAKYFSALAKYNESRIPDPKKMRPGMKVVVPPAEALHTRYPKLCGVQPSVAAATRLPSGFFVGEDGLPRYRVGDRDTLSGIAHAHLGRASRWVQVYEMNRERIPKPDTLRIGAVLRLPADASSVRLTRTAQSNR